MRRKKNKLICCAQSGKVALGAREEVTLPDSINVNVNIVSKTLNVREGAESSTPSQRGKVVVDLRPT